MRVPVYIVTGFLSAGKTTFLNNFLNGKKWNQSRLLVIQFESGEEDFQFESNHSISIAFSRKMLDQDPQQMAGQMAECIGVGRFDAIWIEWNGMIPFSSLYGLLLHPSLQQLCKVRKVLHVADGDTIENLLGRTGDALLEQIANSDLIIVRNIHTKYRFMQIKELFHSMNSKADTVSIRSHQRIYQQMVDKRKFPTQILWVFFLIIVLFHSVFHQIYEVSKAPFNTIINLFAGIMLQAIPFLLIGILLSTAIQIFIPKETIERRFPKSIGMGILVAVLCGFLLPVCDCASIPIFRSLVRKGVPLSAAVTFLTVTPVVNPVVILSTYYAFGGNMNVVLGRVCCGTIAAVIIGVIFALFPTTERILQRTYTDGIGCRCGCYDAGESTMTQGGKVSIFLRHSQAEFFDVGKYLVIGALISSVLQTFGGKLSTVADSGLGFVLSIIVMMILAFLLSLCSSSDAVIARGFANQLPMGAVMGFLIFGPMMDLKNVLMLSGSFSKDFIRKLVLVTFLVCFAVAILFSIFGGI
jgi:uncharacterized protein